MNETNAFMDSLLLDNTPLDTLINKAPAEWFITLEPPRCECVSASLLSGLVANRSYNLSQIIGKYRSGDVLVWSEKTHEFLLFLCHHILEQYIIAHKEEERNFHEKLFRDVRLFLDVDDKKCKMTHKWVMEKLIPAMQYCIQKLFGVMIFEEDIIIADSTNAMKQSFHMIFNKYYVKNNALVRCFATELVRILPDCKEFVDLQVYGSTSGMRLPYCTKVGQVRPKKLPADVLFRSALISNVDECDELALQTAMYVAPAHLDQTLAKGAALKIVEAVNLTNPTYLDGLRFRNERGVFINFDRVAPSACPVSGDTHHRENTVFIIGGGGSAVIKCRHCPGKITIHVDALVVGAGRGNDVIEQAQAQLPLQIMAAQKPKTEEMPAKESGHHY